jgi:hypothetical protein
MTAHVCLESISQIRAVRRVLDAVSNQFVPSRERDEAGEIVQARKSEPRHEACKLSGVKRVRRKDRLEQRSSFAELQILDLISVREFVHCRRARFSG